MSQQIIFYILAAVILVFSVMTVSSKKILRASVYLLMVLMATAGIYFMFNYNFLAGVQLTVYAGGITVLIIFSILLTHHISEEMPQPPVWQKILAGIVAVLGSVMTIIQILNYDFKVVDTEVVADVSIIGKQMLSYGEGGYVLPFEVVSILLLAAMVASIVVAKRKVKS